MKILPKKGKRKKPYLTAFRENYNKKTQRRIKIVGIYNFLLYGKKTDKI
jgi:hypothetical protein